MIYSAINFPESEFTVSLTWVYAHGSLEELLDYDIIVTNSLKVYYLYSNIEKGIMNEGMVETTATNGDQTIDVLVFMWKGKDIIRGLVVDKNNEEDVKFATDAYKEKKEHL